MTLRQGSTIPPWLAREVTALVFRSLHHLDSFSILNRSQQEKEQRPRFWYSLLPLLASPPPMRCTWLFHCTLVSLKACLAFLLASIFSLSGVIPLRKRSNFNYFTQKPGTLPNSLWRWRSVIDFNSNVVGSKEIEIQYPCGPKFILNSCGPGLTQRSFGSEFCFFITLYVLSGYLSSS